MEQQLSVKVNSEIGKLTHVMLHSPGKEVENMTPENAQRALYSDILNLQVAAEEYKQFDALLNKLTNVHYMDDLLERILKNDAVKFDLIEVLSKLEHVGSVRDELLNLDAKNLSRVLIEGLPLHQKSLTNYLSKERYALQPLHNFFFMRDASVSLWNNVLISRMANSVRQREALIMNSIFAQAFTTRVINPLKVINPNHKVSLEGGDVLIASDNLLVIGIGKRTTPQGVDFIIDQLKRLRNDDFTVIVQELPDAPESFIHLDMAFTFLDKDACMIYAPLILNKNAFQTIKIEVKNSEVKKISNYDNLIKALESANMPVKPIYCGGTKDTWIQEREQWHSGTNFFAFAPGKVIGYARNTYTIDELNKNGFEVLTAKEVIDGTKTPDDYKKCVVTLEGSELARGGGGARCMTMPFGRENV